MTRKHKIATLQLKLNGTPAENLEKNKQWVRKAAKKGAEIICLSEFYKTHYFCQSEDPDNFKLAEPLYGESFTEFSALAKELSVVIIVSFFEKRMDGVYYNSAYTIDADGSMADLYRKMHLPDDPQFYEKYYFSHGDLGFKSVQTQKAKLGTLICWDQWYPEAARLTALKGAEILFYPTAIAWHPTDSEEVQQRQYEAWVSVIRGHAVANGIHIAVANRIGLENYLPDSEGLLFWGQSFIVGPQGTILAQASKDQEEILMVEVDLDYQEYIRQTWPFFRDRRIDHFSELTKRTIDQVE